MAGACSIGVISRIISHAVQKLYQTSNHTQSKDYIRFKSHIRHHFTQSGNTLFPILMAKSELDTKSFSLLSWMFPAKSSNSIFTVYYVIPKLLSHLSSNVTSDVHCRKQCLRKLWRFWFNFDYKYYCLLNILSKNLYCVEPYRRKDKFMMEDVSVKSLFEPLWERAVYKNVTPDNSIPFVNI